MADNVTDPLEKAVLSGAIFAGPDPEGEEPYRPASDDDFDSDDNGDATGFSNGDATESQSMPAGPVKTTKGQSHNTGVKGVLADYRNRNQDKTSQPSKKEMSKTRKAFKSLSTSSRKKNSDRESSDISSSAELSEGENDARDAYRRKRMEEMRLMGSSERQENASRQKFGHLREVGQSQFIRAVEDRSAHRVVVHVYDSSLPSCVVMNTHLSSLARRYPYTKFLRARSRDLEFARGDEEDVLPTLLVYSQGEVINNLVAFDRELSIANGGDEDDEVDSSSISRDMVEKALTRHGILQARQAVQADSSAEDDDSE